MNKQILSILTAALALVSGLNAAPSFVNIGTIPGNTTVNGTKVTLIRTSQRWTANNVYILPNLVFVESPAVLTIEPGTIIRMEEKLNGGTSITDPADPGTLIICRGAKIVANGTAESPIVFTSIDDPYVAGGAATIPTTHNGAALTPKNYTGNGRFSRDSLAGGLIVLGRSNLGFGNPGVGGGISVGVTAAGSGYTSRPAVGISGGGGSGATFTAILNPSTVATGTLNITVTTKGVYPNSTPPTLAIARDAGSAAAATVSMALINGGAGVDNIGGNADDGTYEISSVNVTGGGTFYTTAPAVTLTQPAGNVPTTPGVVSTPAKLVGTSVAQITVGNPGTGFATVPTVALTGGGGSGATAVANLGGTFADPTASPLTSGVGANFIEGFQTIDGATLGQGSGSIYGGSDDNDNSGLIRFASIRYGGFILSPNNEINGLTTGATGRNTYFEFIEVVNNADDDIEHFGGLCNMKYVAGLFGGDDGIDIDQGYRGKIQFALQVQNNAFDLNGTTATGRNSSNAGDNLGEFDGSESPNTSKPYSVWTMFNFTGIGVGYGSASKTDRSGPNFKDNAGGKILNSLFVNVPSGAVQIQGTSGSQSGAHAIARFQEIRTSGGEFNELGVAAAASEPDAILNYVTWMRCGANSDTVPANSVLFPAASGRTTSGGSAINDANIVAKIRTNNGNNIFQGGIDLVSINAFSLDPRLKANVASRDDGVSPRTGTSSVGSGTAGPVGTVVDRGTFFTHNTFRGAMRDCNWLNGWSLLNEWGTMSEASNIAIPDVTLNRTSGKLIANFPTDTGVQYSVETSTDNKTFTPKQTVTGTGAIYPADLGTSTALTFVRVLPL
jgi:hypothetical protein